LTRAPPPPTLILSYPISNQSSQWQLDVAATTPQRALHPKKVEADTTRQAVVATTGPKPPLCKAEVDITDNAQLMTKVVADTTKAGPGQSHRFLFRAAQHVLLSNKRRSNWTSRTGFPTYLDTFLPTTSLWSISLFFDGPGLGHTNTTHFDFFPSLPSKGIVSHFPTQNLYQHHI